VYGQILGEVGDMMKSNGKELVERTNIIEANKDICTFIAKNKTGNK
tara:strand:- start:530 stop:667 length:138 start_codon:yes stop_codon:yes gene_type:complete